MSEEIEDSGSEIEESAVESPEIEQSGDAGGVETPAETPDVWSNFRQLEQFQGQEDAAIAQSLYESMQREEVASRALQQYQSTIPIVQEYLSNRQEYEAWRQGGQAAQQQPVPNQPASPQQEQQEGWWQGPSLKDSHRRYLVKDENGRDVISQDAPLDARAALEDYMTYRADFAQKFLDNPEQALGGMVEKIAAQRAEDIVETRLGRMQDETYVSSLESENKDWLYDQQGNVSAEGLAVQKYISDAKGMGIDGAKQRWDFATKMVERDLLIRTMQNQQAQQQQVYQQPVQQAPPPQQPTADQQNMEYLRNQAMRTASQRSAVTTNAGVPEKSMTFQERLLSAAQDQGMF
jgi:hypothetical protein